MDNIRNISDLSFANFLNMQPAESSSSSSSSKVDNTIIELQPVRILSGLNGQENPQEIRSSFTNHIDNDPITPADFVKRANNHGIVIWYSSHEKTFAFTTSAMKKFEKIEEDLLEYFLINSDITIEVSLNTAADIKNLLEFSSKFGKKITSLELTGGQSEFKEGDLRNLIKNCPNMTSLELNEWLRMPENELSEIKMLSQLKELRITDCAGFFELPELAQLKNIKTIKIQHCGNFRIIPELKQQTLKTLDVWGCKSLRNIEGFGKLLERKVEVFAEGTLA